MPKATVAQITDIEADGGIKCDLGGDTVRADHYSDPGDDCQPLVGDFVALGAAPGAGTVQATGYLDGQNASQAKPGEKRIYSRDQAGTLVAEVWLTNDGTVTIRSLKATAGGVVVIDPSSGDVTVNGNARISASGEVTAKLSDAGGYNLSTHPTPSPMGPLYPAPG